MADGVSWPRGCWIGGAHLAALVIPHVRHVDAWSTLDPGDDVGAADAVVLAALLDATGSLPERVPHVPRVAVVIEDVGPSGSALRARTTGAAVAWVRQEALRVVGQGSTVNVVRLPAAGSPPGPLGVPPDPHDVASALDLFLAPEAGYLTGQVLSLDGGRAAWNGVVV